jgi:hypothetical protein
MASKSEREKLKAAFVSLFVSQGESQESAERLADAAVSGVPEDAEQEVGAVSEAKRGDLRTVHIEELGSIVGRVR